MHVTDMNQAVRLGVAGLLGMPARRATAPAAPLPAVRPPQPRAKTADFSHLANGPAQLAAALNRLLPAGPDPRQVAYDAETERTARFMQCTTTGATVEAYRIGRAQGLPMATGADVLAAGAKRDQPTAAAPLVVGSIPWQIIQAGKKRRGEIPY